MKAIVLCGVVLSIAMGSSTAIAGAKWGSWGIPMYGVERGFERIAHANKFESSRYEQSQQWNNLEEKPLLDISKLYRANILKKHYITRKDIATIEVGFNFYHLSGEDKRRVLKSFDKIHHYTTGEAQRILILDGVTRDIVGEYGPEGIVLQ